MVLVKRKLTCSSDLSIRSPWKLSVAYGDGRISPKMPLSPLVPVSPESGTTGTFSFEPTPKKPLPPWTIKALCLVIACSWIGAYTTTRQAKAVLNGTRYDHELQTAYTSEAIQTLHDAHYSRTSMQTKIEHMEHENAILKHEARMANEMHEAGEYGTYGVAQHGMVKQYMQRRKESLQQKAKMLQDYLQRTSREALLVEYGPGPHRVKMLVEFTDSKIQGSFVIDLASDLMPHSSKLFLDQVKLGLWDKTVFWHHEGVDHVISSAAVSYKTGESRLHHFGALGVGGVGFGEYSDQMPHELWTVGFSGKGPEFYINSADNTKLHGPGGNAHIHNSADEGDPCFGKIVEGLSVVKEMYQLSQKQTELAAKQKDWHDNELTHILKAEILTTK